MATAAATSAGSSSELLCVLFQVMEIRNARLEGSDTAVVRVRLNADESKDFQVHLFFFKLRARAVCCGLSSVLERTVDMWH